MKAQLLAHSGEDRGRTWTFEAEATIGRGVKNTVRLRDGTRKISSEHARIVFDAKKGVYVLEDRSKNGTFLAGERLHGSAKLLNLDIVGFAGIADLIFRVIPDAAAKARGSP